MLKTQVEQTVPVRHLLYNCCAMEHSEEWFLNVRKLNEYAHVFTGRRLVILRTGAGIVEPEAVKKEFAFDAEFIELPNSKALQEVSGFVETLSKLKSLNADEHIFYAHTKGVRYLRGDSKIPSIRMWRDAMYEGCLSGIEQVDEALKTHACCGCFKQKTQTAWDFSGSFWWVSSAALFSHPTWDDASHFRSIYSTEEYLGRLFPSARGYSLTGVSTRSLNLYTMVEPARRERMNLSKNSLSDRLVYVQLPRQVKLKRSGLLNREFEKLGEEKFVELLKSHPKVSLADAAACVERLKGQGVEG